MKILCTSDIHLGRIPHLPAVPGLDLTHRSAWDFVLEAAHRTRPDLLVLAGDIIDADNQFLETWGPLRDGVLGLLRAGITIAAVAGNHDSEVFPELHRVLAGEPGLPPDTAFHLLGPRTPASSGIDHWSMVRFERGGERLWLAGWSFPERTSRANALSAFRPAPDGTPVLGILHGDLGAPGSSHGPISREDLRAAPAARWVLGHLHVPGGAEGERHFYCGSPFPLRKSEQGAHGLWMLEYGGGVFGAPVLIPCPVRVDALEVDLGEATATEATVSARLTVAIQERVRAIQATHPGLQALYLRLRLTGRQALGDLLPRLEPGLVALAPFDGVAVQILDKVEDACTAPIPLEAWARRQGACGRIARLLLSLQSGAPDAEARQLMAELQQEDRESRSLNPYRVMADSLRDPEVGTDAWARATLMRSCWRLLDGIWAQEEAHG